MTAKAKKSENQTVVLPKPCNIVTYTYFYKKYYYYYVDFIQLFPRPTPDFVLHTSSVTRVTSVTFFPAKISILINDLYYMSIYGTIGCWWGMYLPRTTK